MSRPFARAMFHVKCESVVARNTLWMLLGQGLRLIIQAVYFIEIARSLGASNYGAFVGVVALVGIAVPFSDLGSGNLLVKNVSRDQRLFDLYWGRALVAVAVSGSALLVAVLLISRFVLSSAIPLRLVLLVSVSDLLGLSIITMCGLAFLAFDRLKWTAAINVMISASRLLGVVLLIDTHPHPSPLQWGYVYLCSTTTVAIVGVLLVCSKLGRPILWRHGSMDEIREGLYYSVGLSAQTIYNDIDKTMLTRLGSLEATGIYGAAYRLIDVCFVPIGSVLSASYANFFRAGANGVAACLAYARPILVRSLIYPIAVCVALQVSAGLVPHILGGEYEKTAEALRWLSPLPVLKLFSYFFSNILTGAGYQKVRSYVQAGVALFNVLVNLWVIPLYSWRGAAWSSIVSDALLAYGTGTAVVMLARREKLVVVVAVDVLA
jgi:O-antigen/teichoic acid export membrane protein